MAPILLDKRDLLKLGIVSVLTIVLAFAAGFMFGQQQAAFSHASLSHAALNIEHAELSPAQAPPASRVSSFTSTEEVATRSREPQDVRSLNLRQYNEAISANPSGREPADTTMSGAGSKTKGALQTEQSHVAKIADMRLVGQQHSSKQQSSKQQGRLHQVESSNKTRPERDSLRTAEGAVQPNTPALAKDSDSSADVAKYSIQVAVYARLINAKSMMESLQEKNLDAYITDYINKKNRTRFTVRFGYFKDKASARQALESYMHKHDGDGYLVNFSSDDIVDVSQAKDAQLVPQVNLQGGAQ